MRILLLIFALTFALFSNDSEYYTSGNELVPIDSKNIRLDKEFLCITRHPKGMSKFAVEVKYTLFNEGNAKDVIIGFEAPGRIGDNKPDGFFFKDIDEKKLYKSQTNGVCI